MPSSSSSPRVPLTLEEEKRLLERLKAGDRRAFRELYDAFADRLYRAAILPRIGVPDLAEDVLRDTFLSAFEKIGTVTWQDRSLYYWLSRIAYHKVIDLHRSRKRTERFVQGYTPYVELSASGPRGPEEAYLGEEGAALTRELVHELVGGLNERYRRAVELRFFQGLEREACAEAMEVTLGNFDVILFRAIKRLKSLYDERQGR